MMLKQTANSFFLFFLMAVCCFAADADRDGIQDSEDLWPLDAAKPVTSELWGSQGELWTPQSHLPFVAFAGYHEGKDPLPTVTRIVADVTAYGATGTEGSANDTQAFLDAIAAARTLVSSTNHGVIYVPAGVYDVDQSLLLDQSGLILRGAGRELTTIRNTSAGNAFISVGSAGYNWIHDTWASTFCAKLDTARLPKRGDFIIHLAAPLNPTLKQNIVAQKYRMRLAQDMQWGVDSATPEFAANMYGGADFALPGSSGSIRVSQQVVVTIGEDDKVLYLDRPLRFTPTSEILWNNGVMISVRDQSVDWENEEIGVEDLTIECPDVAYTTHFMSEPFSGIEINSCNSWVRGVRVINGDGGISTALGTMNNEIADCIIGATRDPMTWGPTDPVFLRVYGHVGFGISGFDNMLRDFKIEADYIHDVTTAGTQGCVIMRGEAANMNMDHHRKCIYGNVWTENKLGSSHRMFQSSGDDQEGLRSAAYNVFWNLVSDHPQFAYWPGADPWMEGAWGYAVTALVGTDIKDFPDLTEMRAINSWYDPADAHLEPISQDLLYPQNIYEAQRQAYRNGTLWPTYDVIANAGANGTLVPSGTVKAIEGASACFTITPDAGYNVADVVIDGLSVGTLDSYVFSNLAANHSISVTFEEIADVTLTYTAATGGVIHGPATQTIQAGTDAEGVIALATDGYRFVSWSDGVTTPVRKDLAVSVDMTISATFESAGSSPFFLREVWDDISGNTVADLTGSAGYQNNLPDHSSSVFSFDTWGYDQLSGQRHSGLIRAPVTGDYIFQVTSDDSSELWLSTDATTENRQMIAYVDLSYTGQYDYTLRANQSSSPITLVAGQVYYIEVLHKTGYGSEHCSLRWYVPGVTDPVILDATFIAERTDTVTPNYPDKQLSYLCNPGHGTISGTANQLVAHETDGTPVTATPASGYRFLRWSDGATSATRQETTVLYNQTYTAFFAADPVSLSYTAGANGSVTGPQNQSLLPGQTGFAVTAVPDHGYYFTQWSDGNTSSTRTDVATSAGLTVTATFAGDTTKPTITAITIPSVVISGRPTSLSVTASDDICATNVLYATWDLDNDGAYDDATGLSITHTYPLDAVGTNPVSVRVEDGAGNATIAADSLRVRSYNYRYLSDMEWTSASSGFGEDVQRDANAEGNPIFLNGVAYEKGLGCKGYSEIIYPLNGLYTTLITDIGIDDSRDGRGTVNFEVWMDGVKAYDSGAVFGSDIPPTLYLDIASVTELKLIVTNGGNSHVDDHAAWADARVVTNTEDYEAPVLSLNAPASAVWGTVVPLSVNVSDDTAASDDLLVTWDLDGDGLLDDAIGSSLNYNFAPPSNGFVDVTVRVRDLAGKVSEATARIWLTAPDVVYLSDLSWVSASIGWGTVQLDADVKGNPITINSIEYDKGLGTRAHSEIVYDLNGIYSSFSTIAYTAGSGAASFEVWVDGTKVHDSGPVTKTDLGIVIDVDVTGAQQLTLIETDGGDGTGGDEAVWADAKLGVTNYTVTASAGPNGTITPVGGFKVLAGRSLTCTISPAAGYQVADVLVNGLSVGTVSSYTFDTVQADQMISCTFEELPTWTITATSGANGEITPNGVVQVDENGSQLFTITPAAGYQIADVQVDGSSVGAVDTYQITDVTDNHTISCTFELISVNSHTLTLQTDDTPGASLSGPATQNIVDGASSTAVTAVAPAGYTFTRWTSNGLDFSQDNPLTVVNVTEDMTLKAEFSKNTVTMVASVNDLTVAEGGTASFTLWLSAQPTSTTTIAVSLNGDSDLTVSSETSLEFSIDTWDTPQTITIIAAEDADSIHGTTTISCTAAGLPVKSLTVTESDNDQPSGGGSSGGGGGGCALNATTSNSSVFAVIVMLLAMIIIRARLYVESTE